MAAKRFIKVLNLSRGHLRVGKTQIPPARNNPQATALDLNDVAVRKMLKTHADQLVVAGGFSPNLSTFEYDFDVQGGAVGAKTLTAVHGKLPDNAVILSVRTEGVTAPTSGGSATVALGHTGVATGYLTATAYNDASFAADAVTARTGNLKVNNADGVDVLATIATAALTAGKFRVHVEWVEGV